MNPSLLLDVGLVLEVAAVAVSHLGVELVVEVVAIVVHVEEVAVEGLTIVLVTLNLNRSRCISLDISSPEGTFSQDTCSL